MEITNYDENSVYYNIYGDLLEILSCALLKNQICSQLSQMKKKLIMNRYTIAKLLSIIQI